MIALISKDYECQLGTWLGHSTGDFFTLRLYLPHLAGTRNEQGATPT